MNSFSKFNVGDRVKINPDIEPNKIYEGIKAYPLMAKQAGAIGIVSKVDKSEVGFYYEVEDEDDEDFCVTGFTWSEPMLVKA